MRQLTLHEKISIKGLIKKRLDVATPRLDMPYVLYTFHRIFGRSVAEWHRYTIPVNRLHDHPWRRR